MAEAQCITRVTSQHKPQDAEKIGEDLNEAMVLLNSIIGYAKDLSQLGISDRAGLDSQVGRLARAVDLTARRAGCLVDRSFNALTGDTYCGGLDNWHRIGIDS